MSCPKVNISGGMNGDWICTKRGWQYKEGTGYVVRVPKTCSYNELVNTLQKKYKIDFRSNELVLTVSFNARAPPCVVTGDDEVEALITNILEDHDAILCVNVKAKQPITDMTDDQRETNEIGDEGTYNEPLEDDEADIGDTPQSPPFIDEADEIGDVTHVVSSGGIKMPRFNAFVDHERLAAKRIELKTKWQGRCILPPYVESEINSLTGATHSNELDEGICVGQYYVSKAALVNALSMDALENNYQFKTYKSEPAFVIYICSEGKDVCEWRLRAKLISAGDATMKITKFKSVHTCVIRSIQKSNHRQAKPLVVGELYVDKVMMSGGEFTARALQADMKTQYGIDMNYQTAYRCRQRALDMVQGTPEQSYALLPGYFAMLKKNNPDTICDIALDDKGAFLYCYFCLGVSREGFKACRPLICVDATHLKNAFKGQLICAIALDADDHLYPLAFSIVNSENDGAYMYFMSWLKRTIGDIPGLVFISDRHISISNALQAHFKEAHHGICYYHLKGNVKDNHKDKEKQCLGWLKGAAYAYTKAVFWQNFNKIKIKNEVLAKDLEAIGFARWARAFFPGMRYAVITNNYCESFNSNLREARKWTVTALVEYIRQVLRRWHYDRLQATYAMTKPLAPDMEKRLDINFDEGRYLTAVPIGMYEFEVTGKKTKMQKVDLNNRKCSCKRFDIDGIPCKHAMAAIRTRGGGKYEFCSWYFTVEALQETYAGKVYPCGDVSDWVLPDHIKQIKVGVPDPRPMPGRPKKSKGRRPTKRILSQGEGNEEGYRCGKCKQPGHNARTCRWY